MIVLDELFLDDGFTTRCHLVLLQGLRLHMAYADADRPGSRLAFRHLLGGVISRVVPACVNKQ
jgi:hypothetical protein